MTGITGFGGYIPLSRLQRSAIYAANSWFAPGLRGLAKGERSVANWDEDVITMAVEAARDALENQDRARIGNIVLASTNLPFLDRSNSGVIKEALNLEDNSGSMDITGSGRAGTSALLSALTSNSAKDTLVLGAELRKALPASEGELIQGDGAAAIIVGSQNIIAKLLGSYSTTIDFVDHFRAAEAQTDYSWESRWIRDEGYTKILGGAITTGLAQIGVNAAEIDYFICPITAKGVADGLAKRASIRPEAIVANLSDTVGEVGSAHSLLLLAQVLENATAGQKILVAGFGQGADILVFEATDKIGSSAPRLGVSGAVKRARQENNYMKLLFWRGALKLDRGMRAEADQKQPLTSLYRNRKAVLGLIGGKCSKTGTVQFPKTEISVNPNDHTVRTQEDYPLAEIKARIFTYTADSLTYSPNPPNCYGNIDFEGGGRMMAEFTDISPEELEVGKELRMMFRIKAIDEARDFKRYFWKAAPAY